MVSQSGARFICISVHQSLGQSLGKSSLSVSLSVCCRTLIALSYAQQGAADGMEEVAVQISSRALLLSAGSISRMHQPCALDCLYWILHTGTVLY